MSRRFGVAQRSVLFLASGGCCALCGVPLGPGWHADHVVPRTLGGSTDTVNGQALCPPCNLRKGGRMALAPWVKLLRKWQERAFNKFMALGKDDFLLVATPGAGKTLWALRIVHEFITSGRAGRIVVVVPTENLKYQWAKEAARIGVHLDPNWSNGSGAVAADYHGVVVTYSQIDSNPDAVRYLCRTATLAVLDEVHHCGDGRSWGRSVRHALESAIFRLSLSGTPFREDSQPIPFVEYLDGNSVADFDHSYGAALGEDDCRPILFPTFEGQMKWYSKGRDFEHSFADPLGEYRSAQRLKTALDPAGDLMRQMIEAADKKLSWVRLSHPDAGGLVVVKDKEHARPIAKLLHGIAGEEPTVVYYDEPRSSDMIDEFARGRGRWIVAIRMVSEGVDIPRLRVGVFATNVLTEMFFRQVVGRFVRVIVGLEEQNSYLFFPGDPKLVGFAEAIKQERQHHLDAQVEAAKREAEEAEDRTDDKVASTFVPIHARGRAHDVIFDQGKVTQAEIAEAEAIRRGQPGAANWDPAILAMILRQYGRSHGHAAAGSGAGFGPSPGPDAGVDPGGEDPKHVLKKAKRKVVHKLVGKLVGMSDGDLDYQIIFSRLRDRDRVYQEHATIDQLVARIAILERWIEEYPDVR